ncbi:MAG: hypothetical protein ACFFA4_11825 [Promethearchaeota archaeon]
MRKGPVCYIYYAIKNKRELKLEQEKRTSENKDLISQTELYSSHQ